MINKYNILLKYIYSFSLIIGFVFLFIDVVKYYKNTTEYTLNNGFYFVFNYTITLIYLSIYILIYLFENIIVSYIYFGLEEELTDDYSLGVIRYGRTITTLLFSLKKATYYFPYITTNYIFVYGLYSFIIYIISANQKGQTSIKPTIDSIVYVKLFFDISCISFLSVYIIRLINDRNREIIEDNIIENINNSPESVYAPSPIPFSRGNNLIIINSYRVHPMDIPNDFNCSICLENRNNIIISLECEHIFHKNCIDTWISRNITPKTCPICRHELQVRRSREVVNNLNDMLENIGNRQRLERTRPRNIQIPIERVVNIENRNDTPPFPNRVIY